MRLIDQIQEDLKRSMKAKDGTRVSVLRFLMASIKNREKEKRDALDEDELLAVITASAKQRRESVEAFSQGDRPDLVRKEEAELAILLEYLPDQLAPEAVREVVQAVVQELGASSPEDLGRVMKELMPRLRGRADGKLVNRIAREVLAD